MSEKYCKNCNLKVEQFNGGKSLGTFWVHSNTKQAICDYTGSAMRGRAIPTDPKLLPTVKNDDKSL